MMYKYRHMYKFFKQQILLTYIVRWLDKCSKIVQYERCIHQDYIKQTHDLDSPVEYSKPQINQNYI